MTWLGRFPPFTEPFGPLHGNRIRSSTSPTNARNPSPTFSITNVMFAFLPMAILFMLAQLGPGWKLLRFSLMALSFVCYALRIALMQFRRKEMRRPFVDKRWPWTVPPTVSRSWTNTACTSTPTPRSPPCSALTAQTASSASLGESSTPSRNSALGNRKFAHPWQTPENGPRSFPFAVPMGSALSAEITITLMPDGGTVCSCRDFRSASKPRKRAPKPKPNIARSSNRSTPLPTSRKSVSTASGITSARRLKRCWVTRPTSGWPSLTIGATSFTLTIWPPSRPQKKGAAG